MTVTVRFSDTELEAVRGYAELQGKTVSAILRNSILERIEDEFDLKIAAKAYDEFKKDNKKTINHEELGRKLGLI